MNKSIFPFEYYLSKVPEQYRKNISLVDVFVNKLSEIIVYHECGHSVKMKVRALFKKASYERCILCIKSLPRTNKESKGDKVEEVKEILEIEGIDYVKCFICGISQKSLARHVKQVHGMNPKEYSKNHKIICDKSHEKYKNQNSINNSGWLLKANDMGCDLTDYKANLSKGVREFISNNPEDLKRRADVMAKVNKSDVMRKKVSETAIKTSARKDIQEKRAAQLKKWRDENREEFFEKCINKLLNIYHSKPELELFEIVKQNKNFNFKLNQTVKSEDFISKSKRKQVDIGDKNKRVYIEYDGALHFIKSKITNHELISKKDYLLDKHIEKHNWTLIRVSYDQYSYRKSDYGFKKECLDKINEILEKKIPGVYKIGDAYDSKLEPLQEAVEYLKSNEIITGIDDFDKITQDKIQVSNG